MPENKFSASGDSTPAIVTDHPFQPDKRGWWSLCRKRRPYMTDATPRFCHLAESAHATTTVKDEDRRQRPKPHLNTRWRESPFG
jgi:hypothetical protein